MTMCGVNCTCYNKCATDTSKKLALKDRSFITYPPRSTYDFVNIVINKLVRINGHLLNFKME